MAKPGYFARGIVVRRRTVVLRRRKRTPPAGFPEGASPNESDTGQARRRPRLRRSGSVIRAISLLLAPTLALGVLAAHFVRAQMLVGAALCVAPIVLLAVPRAWAARVVQIALVIGALEWARTLAALLAARMAIGQPYLRMTAILAVVALLTLASAWVFRSKSLRNRYRLG